MKTLLFSPLPLNRLLLTLSLVVLSLTSRAKAQVDSDFLINKIDPLIVTTPMIGYTGATLKPDHPKAWMEINVSFTWKPRNPAEKYSDDVVFNYYVLLSNKSAAFPQGVMLTGQVTHNSIPANQNDLKTVMYVSPRSLERFFDGRPPSSAEAGLVDIGITISKQGQVVAQKSLHGSGAWWPQYQQTPGYLLDKSQTPFAALIPDYYETPVKRQQ